MPPRRRGREVKRSGRSDCLLSVCISMLCGSLLHAQGPRAKEVTYLHTGTTTENTCLYIILFKFSNPRRWLTLNILLHRYLCTATVWSVFDTMKSTALTQPQPALPGFRSAYPPLGSGQEVFTMPSCTYLPTMPTMPQYLPTYHFTSLQPCMYIAGC